MKTNEDYKNELNYINIKKDMLVEILLMQASRRYGNINNILIDQLSKYQSSIKILENKMNKN